MASNTDYSNAHMTSGSFNRWQTPCLQETQRRSKPYTGQHPGQWHSANVAQEQSPFVQSLMEFESQCAAHSRFNASTAANAAGRSGLSQGMPLAASLALAHMIQVSVEVEAGQGEGPGARPGGARGWAQQQQAEEAEGAARCVPGHGPGPVLAGHRDGAVVHVPPQVHPGPAVVGRLCGRGDISSSREPEIQC